MSIRNLGGNCEVIVKGPSQTRKRLFFDGSHALPEKVRDWLRAYPPIVEVECCRIGIRNVT